MQKLFSPAIRLLNRLKYPQKFTLISLLFILPLAVVMFLLISQMNQRINFARHELAGNAYLRPLRHLLADIPQHNLLHQQSVGGSRSLQDPLIRTQAAVDQHLEALAAVEQQHGDTLGTTTQYQALRAQWRSLKDDLPNLDRPEIAQRHAKLVAAVRGLMSHVGDSSNLILDPDLDSYYLMDAVLLKLPEQQDLIAQAMLLTNDQTASGGDNAAYDAQMTVIAGRLRANVDEINRGMDVAYAHNPSGTARDVLQQPVAAATTAINEFAQISNQLVNRTTTDRELINERGQNGLAASFSLWDRASAELDKALQFRINQFVQQKYAVLVFALLVLVVVAYLLAAFYQSVMRTVMSLDQAAKSLVHGDTARLVQLDNQDELGQVATSFNKIATAFLEASAQRKAIVDNAVDGIITLDRQGNVTSFNPAAQQMFGYTADKILGGTVTRLMPEQATDQMRSGTRHEASRSIKTAHSSRSNSRLAKHSSISIMR